MDDHSLTTCIDQKQRGWRTFPFITGCMAGVGMAVGGVSSNLVVYLIQQFNIRSIDAAQIHDIVSGSFAISPLLGGIISDSCFPCFIVVSASCVACFLGMLLLTLTTAVHSLRPPPCSSGPCEGPTNVQFGVLYTALTLIAVGVGGTRYNAGTLGAYQFDSTSDQATFFNWYIVALFVSSGVGFTGIVYIEDNVGWTWGFGLGAGLAAVSLFVFLQGSRYYRHPKPPKNPFMQVWHAVTSVVERRRMDYSSSEISDYYERVKDGADGSQTPFPSSLDSENDSRPSFTGGNCEEDFVRTLVRLLPLISTSILVSTSLAMQTSLSILQALAMDRHLGPHFLVPAGSLFVFLIFSAALSITLLDRTIYPAWHQITQHQPTPLKKIGLGHIFNILAMAGAAMVESSRLQALSDSTESNMSVLWLAPPLVLLGIGEALHSPGYLTLCYQEFPVWLRGTANGMSGLLGGVGLYASAAVLALVRRNCGWLQDEVNRSRLDYLYLMLTGVVVFNFGYFLLCAWMYKKKAETEI